MSLGAQSAILAGRAICARCGKRERRFVLGGQAKCVRCALRHGPMLRRSFYTAIVVGTILTAINQGNLLLDSVFPAALAWKIPLTYCVPFCVATWGALINSRSSSMAANDEAEVAQSARPQDETSLTPGEPQGL